VAVHDRQGTQLAAATQREVVEIGADRSASWTLDTQAQFEMRLSMGSGAKWFASYPRGVMYVGRGSAANVQPPPRAPKALLHKVYPSTDGGSGRDMGDVRLAPARVRLPGSVALEKHFDDTSWTDGWFTETRNPYVHETKDTLVDSGEDPRPRPFSLSFWWRSMSDAAWTAYDCGMSKFMNRYSIFVHDGDQGAELVFRLCAGTLEEKAAECYVPLRRINYAPGEWFHIQVSASGEDPSSMELLVDGVSVGKRRHLAYLSTGVGLDALELPVDTTDGFHLRGALQIGDEIVEYDLTSQDAFRECLRGARGTVARDWPSNTPVRMLGYSMPLTQDVMAGGSYLTQQLLKMSAVRIDNTTDTATVNVDFGGAAPVPVPIFGVAETTTSFTAELADGSTGVQALWGQGINDVLNAFGTKGYAVIGCPSPTTRSTPGPAGPVRRARPCWRGRASWRIRRWPAASPTRSIPRRRLPKLRPRPRPTPRPRRAGPCPRAGVRPPILRPRVGEARGVAAAQVGAAAAAPAAARAVVRAPRAPTSRSAAGRSSSTRATAAASPSRASRPRRTRRLPTSRRATSSAPTPGTRPTRTTASGRASWSRSRCWPRPEACRGATTSTPPTRRTRRS
jgi:hypothetical protein